MSQRLYLQVILPPKQTYQSSEASIEQVYHPLLLSLYGKLLLYFDTNQDEVDDGAPHSMASNLAHNASVDDQLISGCFNFLPF